jgi:hypothetical protein
MSEPIDELAKRSRNFGFLLRHEPLLVMDGAAAESYLYSDPDAAMAKARRFTETLAKLLVTRTQTRVSGSAHDARIRALTDAGVLVPRIRQAFDDVRLSGNRAVHSHWGDVRAALSCVGTCFELGVWFHRAVTGEPFLQGFVPPPDPAAQAQATSTERAELAELRRDLARQRAQLAEVKAHQDGQISRLEAEARARRQAEAELARTVDDREDLRSLVEQTQQRLAEVEARFEAEMGRAQRVRAVQRDAFIARAQHAAIEPLDRGRGPRPGRDEITVGEFSRQFGADSQMVVAALRARGRRVDGRQPYEFWLRDAFPDTAAPMQSSPPAAAASPVLTRSVGTPMRTRPYSRQSPVYRDRSKVRVYELAKEFGVESKAVMAKLQEMGEFVRSASSTIEPSVVARLKVAFAAQLPQQARPEQSKRSSSGITVYEFARQFGVESQFVIATLRALGRNIDRRQRYELWRKEVFPGTAAPQQSATPAATADPAAPRRPADLPMAGRPPSHPVEPPRRATAQPPRQPGQGQPVGRGTGVEEGLAAGQLENDRADQDGRSHPLRRGGAQRPGLQRLLAPACVLNAVRLMYAGAAVSLISVIVDLASRSELKTAVAGLGQGNTTSQINTAATIYLAVAVAIGVLSVGFWILIARGSKNGNNSARVTGAVLFGIATLQLSTVGDMLVVAGICAVIIWLVGLGAVVLLWQRSSSAFFKGTSATQAPAAAASAGRARYPPSNSQTTPTRSRYK